MRGRLALVATLAAACYAPSAQPGAPCGPADTCPTSQECRSGVCYPTGAPDDASDQIFTDAPIDTAQIAADAPTDGPPYIPWSTPPLSLTTLETPGANETDPSVTTDKLTIVFAADTAVNDADLYIATRAAVTDTFSYTILTALNAATVDDESPEISGDGMTIYFSSKRGGAGGDIYMSTFSTTWSMPAIVPALSTAGDDGDVAISPDGLTSIVIDDTNSKLLFRTRANTTVAFGTPVQHAELHITTDIAAPTLTNNGDTVYFHAGATRQLYVAHRNANGAYTTPTQVTELNVAGVRCAAPFVAQTDDYLIFEKAGNLYETTR